MNHIQQVADVVRSGQCSATKHVAAVVGLTPTQANQALSRAFRQGLIVRVRNGVYVADENQRPVPYGVVAALLASGEQLSPRGAALLCDPPIAEASARKALGRAWMRGELARYRSSGKGYRWAFIYHSPDTKPDRDVFLTDESWVLFYLRRDCNSVDAIIERSELCRDTVLTALKSLVNKGKAHRYLTDRWRSLARTTELRLRRAA